MKPNQPEFSEEGIAMVIVMIVMSLLWAISPVQAGAGLSAGTNYSHQVIANNAAGDPAASVLPAMPPVQAATHESGTRTGRLAVAGGADSR